MGNAKQHLQEYMAEIAALHKASNLLQWDMEVMMPPGAATERGQILAALSALAHEKATAPRMPDLIAAAAAEAQTEWEKRNAALAGNDYRLASQVPKELVAAVTRAQSVCVTAWQSAKASSDWQAVAPHAEALFALIREQAQIFGDILNCGPYDAQLYMNSHGNSQALIDPLFLQLKAALPPLVGQIAEAQRAQPVRQFSLKRKAQEQAARKLAETIGFSFRRGRLDASAHPFSGGTGADSRITTRYSKTQPFSSLFGVMHETGHALYTQNLPGEWQDMPVGSDRDMSLHESQSLIVEKQAGLSEGFLHYLHHQIVLEDPEFSVRAPSADFVRHLRQVKPSFIRVDADEATYPLHVILRYEIEQQLFSGGIAIRDIPEMWNAKMKAYLDLDVPDHARGCMQDIHWFWGLYGYFPTYTQGALYAAQLFDAMKRDIPDVEEHLGRGDFKPFMQWLHDRVHSQGQLYPAPKLIERATGHAPDAKYFLEHLKRRYLEA